MKVQTIGKIQLILGVIILVVSIIFLIWGIKNIYYDTITVNAGQVTSTWGEVINTTPYVNYTADPASFTVKTTIMGHVISGLLGMSTTVKTTMYIFGTNMVILMVLSIILILQGLANLSRK